MSAFYHTYTPPLVLLDIKYPRLVPATKFEKDGVSYTTWGRGLLKSEGLKEYVYIKSDVLALKERIAQRSNAAHLNRVKERSNGYYTSKNSKYITKWGE